MTQTILEIKDAPYPPTILHQIYFDRALECGAISRDEYLAAYNGKAIIFGVCWVVMSKYLSARSDKNSV